VPEARDEYDSYLPVVFARLLDGDRQSIYDYLKSVVEERMELGVDEERTDRVITLLLEWKKCCLKV
jgi:hypothetical protein